MVAQVLVEIKAKNMDKTFTYNIPHNLLNKIKIGIRVLVPFNNKELEGFVLDINDDNNLTYEIKDIISCVDNEPVLNSEMINLGKYMSYKTLANLISCYQTMLPTALKAKNGLIINKKYDTYLKLNSNELIKLNDKQTEIIELIKKEGKVLKSVCNNISTSSVKTLLNRNIIIEEKYEVNRYNIKNTISNNKNVILNDEQEYAVNEVTKNMDVFSPYLLFGVTGSGKTEVYMHIIKKVIDKGKNALVLVPEISLTPQLIDNFKNRFGNDIAVLHSHLSDGEKYDEWRKIESKKANIVIGARSAVFAPLTNIGVIIIDEEHSDTYKQENNPRYHAIDIAIFRAKNYKCPIVLGSATPSIESYTRAKSGVYKLLELKNRVNKNLPKVELVDMRLEIKNGNKILSQKLVDLMKECLDKNEQIILLLNRRGYATTITCHNCGYVQKCPRCDMPLTYHKKNNIMICHYCNYKTYKIKECPNCKNKNVDDLGLGTEKLEQIVKDKFLDSKIIRMDVDTTKTKNAHEKIISSFKNKEYDILIGTQMVAKGLDFSNVTLVGIINGDASLNIPDFRSGERTYALLNQASGRAGRGDKKGYVIIQGFNIDHYSIVYSSNHDYNSFYKQEISIRKKLGYPPFYNLCLIRMAGKDLKLLGEEINKVKNYLNNNLDNNSIVLGPSSSNMPKINNIYYMQIVIKFKKTDKIINNIIYINDIYKVNRKVKLEIDINPLRI